MGWGSAGGGRGGLRTAAPQPQVPLLSLASPKLHWTRPGLVRPVQPSPRLSCSSRRRSFPGPPQAQHHPLLPCRSTAAGLVLGLLSQLLSQPPGPKSPGVWDLPPLGLRHLITSILGLALFPLPWPLGLAHPTPPGGVRLLWHHLPDQVFAEANSAHNDGLVLG